MTTNMHPVSSPSIYGYCNIITTIYLSISFCWMHYVYQRYILYDYYFFFFDCNFFRCSFIFFFMDCCTLFLSILLLLLILLLVTFGDVSVSRLGAMNSGSRQAGLLEDF